MKHRHSKYCPILKGYLSLVFLFAFGPVLADGNQSLISPLGPSLHATGISDAAPAIAYNSLNNEYLIIFPQSDGSCSNERLFGKIINAITGGVVGSAFEISDCNVSINDVKLFFNQDRNEYCVIYEFAADFGSKLLIQTIDAASNEVSQSTEIDNDDFGEPFEQMSIAWIKNLGLYALGYHNKVSSVNIKYYIKYINASSLELTGYSTTINKSTFIPSNDGVTGSKIVVADNSLFISFELTLNAGSEIWGGFIDPQSGNVIDEYFKISPTPQTNENFLNPYAILNTTTQNILVAYEQSHFQSGSGSLNYKIKGQLINSNSGQFMSPNNTPLTNISLPDPNIDNEKEDAKKPVIAYSPLSNEYLLFFYAKNWIGSTAKYDTYFQRIDADDLSVINLNSSKISSVVGTTIAENNLLKELGISYNSLNNQYCFTWFNESDQGINTQIWRYDNNKPKELTISTNIINEELPLGTSIGTLSASDPDPEDSSPSFTLASGTGGDDNSYFEIEGNEVKILKRLSFEDAQTRSIRIRATDSHGESTDKSIGLIINNINEDPYGLRLVGPLTIEENADPESFTSQISVEDDDIGNTHSYALVAGDSADNNGNFEIDQNSGTLKLIEPLNYEDTSMQYVRIRATDNTNLSTVKAFSVQVTDINEAPEGMEISPNYIPENSIESSMSINVIDPDKNSNYVISEVSGSGDDDNIYFDVNGNELRPIILLNYEERQQYSVRLRAFDGVHDITQVFQIQVTDVNDAPDSISISETRIETDLPGGTLIGDLITYDQDETDSHTYTLENGANNFFTNDGQLYTLNSLTYDFTNAENNFYPVVVKSTDQQGEIKLETITIEVVLIKDDENPEIRDFTKNPVYIDENETVLNLSISATDNIEIDTVFFFSRPIRSIMDFQQPEDISIEIQNGTFYVNVPLSTNEMDEVGIEYYFKAFDTSGNTDSSGLGYTYRSFDDKDFSAVNNSYDGSAEAYKIITNPYLLESNQASKIFAEYGASSNDSWRLFGFINGNNKEIGNNTSSSIERGKGYWFNKTEALTQQINFDYARTQQDNKEDPYTLNLVKGWNLIGNPYSFELNWEHVLASNGLLLNEFELYTFNKSYQKATTLHEFEGGFVFTETALNLDVPIDNQLLPGGRIAKNSESGNGWLLNFSLANKNHSYELAALGMHESADASYDAHDSPLLPRFINYLDISFSHPEHFSNAFSKDVVELKENHIWEFVASTNLKDKNATLSWNAQLSRNLGKQLVLYDVLQDKIINVASTNSYSFKLDQPSTFKAIYGDQSFINETLANIKIEALPPYPNPFNYNVAIPMKLPHAQARYSIECSLFNLMGEKIDERKMKDITPGVMEIEWNEELTGKLEKGIYIYSIKVKNGFLTNKFHGRIVKN